MLTLIHGDDPGRLMLRGDELVGGRGASRLTADEIDAAIADIETGDIFGEAKAHHIRLGTDDRPEKKELIAKVARLARASADHVAVVAVPRVLPDTHAMVVAVREAGGSIERIERLEGGALVQWIIERSTALGAPLSRGSAAHLADAFAFEPARLPREIEKAVLLVAAGREGDIRELCASDRLPPKLEFTFADAVADRDLGRSLDALQRLLDAGREPIALVGLLAHRFRALILVNASPDDRAIAAATGMNEWVLRSARRQARSWDRAQLRRALGMLLRLDVSLKRGGHDRGAELICAVIARLLRP